MTRVFHARRARPNRGVFVALRILAAAALAVASLSLRPHSAGAAAGSGTATVLPPGSVEAGKTGTWTITYVAAEDFAPHPNGGIIEVHVPSGWTPPQLTDSTAAGWVKPANSTYVASITTSGQAVRLRLGTPSNRFTTGTAVSVIYGRGGGPASARADTVAPATAVFQVLSDPLDLGALQPIASSPSVSVVAGAVANVRIVNAALQVVGDLSRTTDQDTTHLYLRGYDAYGNSARFVGGSWALTGAIGSAAPASGVGTVLTLTGLGTGIATADSGAFSDSTGAITVVHGALARLAMTAAATAVAGSSFVATVEALDADSNRVTSGPGAADGIRFLAYADSLGSTPADPDLVSDTESLSFGFWSGTRTARRAGLYFLAARDTASGIESSPRRRILVAPAPPDHALLAPDTLRLTAGEPVSVTVFVLDVFGNRVSVSADEELTLWTDRGEGRFTDFSGTPGNEIFAVTIPGGSDSTRFRFTDPRTNVAPGRIRAIDANSAPPFLGTAASPVFTAPNVPAGSILLTAAADTLTANGVDSTLIVSGVARDAYGNAVAAGERFTATGGSVSVVTDDDAGAAGVQWIAASGGTVTGWVRAGTAKGAGSVSVASERGNASGLAALTLIAGPPAGAIALVAIPDSLAADSASVRGIAASGLVDAHGNVVEGGERYTLLTTLGTIATPDADPGTPGVQVSALGGEIAFDLFGGDSLGLATVTAASVRGSSIGNVAVRLVPGNVNAGRSSFAAASPVFVGAPGTAATVTLRDSQGHAIAFFPADSIDISATGVSVTIAPLALATDASGAIAYAVVATVVGSATLGARIPSRGILLDDDAPILFQPGALDHYVVSGPAPPLTAGVGGSLTVEARDAFGNAMPSRSGDILRPVATGGVALLPDSVALVNGTASIAFTPTLAAPLTIQVADDSARAVVYGPVPVGPGAPWRAIAGSPGAATLAAGDSTTVLATLYDAYGNTISGGAIGSAAVSGGGSTSPVLATTDGAGRANFTLRAGVAPGIAAYRIFSPGSAAPESIAADTVSVAIVPATAASIAIAATGPSAVAGAHLDVTLTLRDAFGNRATGATPSIWLHTTSGLPDSISWSLGAGAAGALSDSASGDGARYTFAAADSGVATVRVRATRAETMRLRASSVALPMAESADVAVLAGSPATLAIAGGNGQSAVVTRSLSQPLRVVARDAFGNDAPGASVAFRVTSGNGAVDAIAGGAADSTAATDAAGVATCDVARVGTVAGASNNGYRAGLLLNPAAEVFFAASATPDTAVSLALAPGSFSLAAGQPATVTATARDAYGNGVPGTNVTVYLGTPVAGTLESLGATTGSGASQAGATNAAGQIALRYRAPAAAPAADSIFARGVTLPPTGIRATVGAAAIATLQILPDALTWTAGTPARVRVRALDSFGNVALGDTATIVVGATDPVFWSPAFGALAAGELETFGTATLADTLRVTARTADGAHASIGGPISVQPAAPYRLIADPLASDTLATGDSVSVSARVTDAYGNATAGASVAATVIAGGGSVTPPSAAAGALGDATFTLRAGGTPGAVTLRLLATTSAAPDSVRSDLASIVARPAGASTVEIAAAMASVVAGDPLDVTLTLRDPFGNVASGSTPFVWIRTTSASPDSVSWALGAGAGGALSDSAAGDGARYAFAAADAGVATLRVRGTLAETLRLRASGAGLPLDESGDVAVLPAAPTAIVLLSGDAQSAVVNQPVAQPLRVIVRDRFGNAAPGASVVFRVAAGTGFVDAVAGGAADSLAVTGAGGIAACEVARVGTTAGSGLNSFRAGLLALPAAELYFAASATPAAAATLSLAPGSFGLAASQTATVTATARDAFGNAAPGTSVTLYLGTPTAGTLESLGGTTGSGASQAGVTNAAGLIAIRYRAPSAAPAADSIFARGAAIAPVGIRASVGTSAIVAIRILPDATTWIAGAPARVRVRAFDAFGNVAVADTGTVAMGATDVVAFAPSFGSLVAGSFETFATATLADTLTLTAVLAASAISDSAGPISVIPAVPASSIAATAARTQLTADGRSSAAIAFGPVRDAFGNVVPAGALLTVSAQAGSLLAADVSPLPGIQIATAADDTARAVLIAPSIAGPDTVRGASVTGSASGAIAFAYVAPPSIAYGPGSLAPTIVAPGQSAGFRLLVRNTGAVGSVTIRVASSLAFGAGAGAFAALPAAPLTLGAGVADTLRFAAAPVSTSLPPGTYAPSLRLVGTDATGDPFDFYVGLAGAQIHVAGASVVAAGVSPNPAPLGYGSLVLTFDVSNLAATAASIDGLSLQTSAGIFTVNSVSPALPVSLPALGTSSLAVSVTVPASGIAPGTIVGARLVASVSYGAVSVSAQNAATLDFQVVSAAQLAAQAGGTSPARYLRGRTFAPAARVANSGAAAVSLDRTATRLVFERGPADSLIAPLSSDAVVNGGGTADLTFDSLAVPLSATKGRYAAWLVLRGSESGQPFAATIPLAPDSADVLDPALLVVTGGTSPSVVSAGQSRALSVTISNSGDAPFALDGSTRLVLGVPISTALVPAAADTVPAQGTLAVLFVAAPIGSPLSPGSAAATLEARGTEDGRFRAESLDAGAVTASPPASLSFVVGSAAPDTLRAGQVYAIDAAIRNDGGSPFTVVPASTRLVVSDGVESVVALATGAAFVLAPAAQAVLTFPTAAVPAALASQPYPVTLVVHGTEWGQAESVTVVSPPAEVSVIEPVAAVQVRGLDPGAPVQASAEDGPFRIWTLELQPLVPPGGAASARLLSLSLTVLNDRAPAASPAASIADITLRDALGNLLAQAAPGGSNPVTLTLGAAVALNGPPVPVHVEVTLRPGADVTSIGVRVAAEGDVSVRDDVSGLPVSIRATGGLPFAPLTSPSVTLFAKAHGYPNPFRAGREAVLLSYRLAADAGVRVSIYTLLGDLVRELKLVSGQVGGSRGLNEVAWDGRNGTGGLVRPGVYVAVIEGGGASERIKVGVLR